MSRHTLDRGRSLFTGHVGQPRGADAITRGVDTRNAGGVGGFGSVLVIGFDVALHHFGPKVFGKHAVDSSLNTNRHQDHIGVHLSAS